MEMSPEACAEQRPRLCRFAAAVALAMALAGCALAPKPEPEAQAEPEQPVISEQTRAAFRQAVADLQAQRYAQAAERLAPLAAHDPPLPGALLNLGIARRHLQHYQAAEQALRSALALRGDWPAARVELGIVLRHQGRFDEARQAYQAVLAAAPDHAIAHLNLGVLCDLYLRDLPCAVRHYQRYQSLTDGEDEQVKLWIADINRRLEQQQ